MVKRRYFRKKYIRYNYKNPSKKKTLLKKFIGYKIYHRGRRPERVSPMRLKLFRWKGFIIRDRIRACKKLNYRHLNVYTRSLKYKVRGNAKKKLVSEKYHYLFFIRQRKIDKLRKKRRRRILVLGLRRKKKAIKRRKRSYLKSRLFKYSYSRDKYKTRLGVQTRKNWLFNYKHSFFMEKYRKGSFLRKKIIKSIKYKFVRRKNFMLKFRKKYIDFLCKTTFEDRSDSEVNLLKAKLLTRFQIRILFIFDLLKKGNFDKDLYSKLLGAKGLRLYFLFDFLNKFKELKWRNFCKFLEKNRKKRRAKIFRLRVMIRYLRRLLKIKYFFYLYKRGFINDLDLKVFVQKFFKPKKQYSKAYYFGSLKMLDNLESAGFMKRGSFKGKSFVLHSNGFLKHIINCLDKYLVLKGLKSRRVRRFLKEKRIRRKWALKVYAKFPDWPIRNFIYYERKKKIFNPYFISKVFKFFYRLSPFKLWQLSRRARKNLRGGLFLDFLSFYELRLDVFISSLGLLNSVQETFKLIKTGIFCVDGRSVYNGSIILRPFNILSLKNKSLCDIFRNKFLYNISKRRFVKNSISLPKYVECNFKLFYFMYLPLFNKYIKKAPFFLPEGLNTGKFEIERI